MPLNDDRRRYEITETVFEKKPNDIKDVVSLDLNGEGQRGQPDIVIVPAVFARRPVKFRQPIEGQVHVKVEVVGQQMPNLSIKENR